MTTIDRVTPELRNIERQIDCLYQSNPLVGLPFATAAWHLLATAEEEMLIQQLVRRNRLNDIHLLSTEFATNLEHSMLWLWLFRACNPGGQIPSSYDDELCEASMDLFSLGKKYASVVYTFTRAGRGVFGLELQGSTIQPVGNFFENLAYIAYNYLIDCYHAQQPLRLSNYENFPVDAIEHSLRIEENQFRCRLNPRIVSDMVAFHKPTFDGMFTLPAEWRFTSYSLGEFRKVFERICAISHIHIIARHIAMMKRGRFGNADSIYIEKSDDFLRRIINYSRVSESAVRNILDDLTYGNRCINTPELRLQPLIKLTSDTYAVVPHLWICMSAENSVITLLNKWTSDREAYLEHANTKEEIMRDRIINRLADQGFRMVSENVPDLPDIDLAIISDIEKTALLLELKLFIAPAIARELNEKSKEIEKGISQVLKLKHAFANHSEALLKKLNIDPSYRLEGVVVSENWIGEAPVQSAEIPVIQSDHLIGKLKAVGTLESAIEWLRARKYLPTEGEHFAVGEETIAIGNWTLNAPTADTLLREAFFPL